MLKLFVRIKDTIRTVREEQSGQDGFEYLLVIGVVMVAVVGAIATGIAPTMADAVIAAVTAAVEAAI